MSNEEFLKAFYAFVERALSILMLSRRQGLLAIEESLGKDKAANRDIFEYGMQFVVDGVDGSLIEKILTNIVSQEKDEYQLLLKTIQKEAVLSIQRGDNPRIFVLLLNSYTDIPLNDPLFKKNSGLEDI